MNFRRKYLFKMVHDPTTAKSRAQQQDNPRVKLICLIQTIFKKFLVIFKFIGMFPFDVKSTVQIEKINVTKSSEKL